MKTKPNYKSMDKSIEYVKIRTFWLFTNYTAASWKLKTATEKLGMAFTVQQVILPGTHGLYKGEEQVNKLVQPTNQGQFFL